MSSDVQEKEKYGNIVNSDIIASFMLQCAFVA
jgi:hypothetical protein